MREGEREGEGGGEGGGEELRGGGGGEELREGGWLNSSFCFHLAREPATGQQDERSKRETG